MLDAGAARVYAAATHAVFSRQRVREPRRRAAFEQIVVTDTIPLRPGAPDNIRVLSVRRPADRLDPPIFTDGSVSQVFGGENQLF